MNTKIFKMKLSIVPILICIFSSVLVSGQDNISLNGTWEILESNNESVVEVRSLYFFSSSNELLEASFNYNINTCIIGYYSYKKTNDTLEVTRNGIITTHQVELVGSMVSISVPMGTIYLKNIPANIEISGEFCEYLRKLPETVDGV
jgi:uncharacterized membrane protein